MTKIMVDTDKIDKSLLSQVQNAKTNISNTKQNAEGVNFPNNEYNWSDITSKIGDCEEELIKYINWITEVNNNYKNNINDFKENLEKIKIEKLNFENIL